MKQNIQSALALIVISVLGVFLQGKYLNEFPSHTHAWAQSDRYALSLGFVNNHLNFFKPETFVFNHQFPDNWEVPSKSTVTAVDFPIHDYVPAIFMTISGETSPWIFRLYIFLFSLAGLFFLYKTAIILTNDLYKSILVVVFAATSPVFAFYQGGFLPSIPSLANVFIGIYFYVKYVKGDRSNSDFNKALFFLTFAALGRTTFAIPLIAVLSFEFLRILQKKSNALTKLVPVLFSFSILAFFFFYNMYLRKEYGSIFLNHILPAESFQEFLAILKTVKENWMVQYFSVVHYVLLIFTLLVAFFFLISQKAKIRKGNFSILILTGIIFIGCILFAFLMIRQFPSHDYYFLDTFFLPILMLLMVGLSIIPTFKRKWNNVIYSSILLIICIPFITNAAHSQKLRRVVDYWDRTNSTIDNFKNSGKFLDSLNIPSDSKMLVIDSYAPNIPFILLNRKGYAVMTPSRKNIAEALRWDYDYIVMQDEFFLSDIYSTYPEIITKTSKVSDNGHISISRLNASETDQTLEGYLGLDLKTPVVNEKVDFETLISSAWSNTNATTEFYLSGMHSGILKRNMDYGITYKTKSLPEIFRKNRTLFFQSYVLSSPNKNVEIVVSINEDGKNSYYKAYNLEKILKNSNTWEKVNLVFQLPIVQSKDYEFALFVCNPGKSELFIDDLEFKIY